MGEVVHRVDAPLVARAVMRGVLDPVENTLDVVPLELLLPLAGLEYIVEDEEDDERLLP